MESSIFSRWAENRKDFVNLGFWSKEVNFQLFIHCASLFDFQEYNMGKRVEHLVRSMQYDKDSISAVDPKLYAKRFQEFMKLTFT